MTDKRNSHSWPAQASGQHRGHHPKHQRETHRGELYSRRLKNNHGTSYFFNLKENRESDIYLNIVESRSMQRSESAYGENPSFQRHSILIFAEQRQAFAAECLAALEALAQGQDYCGVVESSQRQFSLQVQHKKKGGLFLSIREDSQRYDKLLQEQIQVPQNSASYFSQALIEILEKWLDNEKQRKPIARKTGHKKVVALRPVVKPTGAESSAAEPSTDKGKGDDGTA